MKPHPTLGARMKFLPILIAAFASAVATAQHSHNNFDETALVASISGFHHVDFTTQTIGRCAMNEEALKKALLKGLGERVSKLPKGDRDDVTLAVQLIVRDTPGQNCQYYARAGMALAAAHPDAHGPALEADLLVDHVFGEVDSQNKHKALEAVMRDLGRRVPDAILHARRTSQIMEQLGVGL